MRKPIKEVFMLVFLQVFNWKFRIHGRRNAITLVRLGPDWLWYIISSVLTAINMASRPENIHRDMLLLSSASAATMITFSCFSIPCGSMGIRV